MFLSLLLLLQSTALPTMDEVRLRDCVKLAEADPPSAILSASEWRKSKGGFGADACLGVAYSAQSKFADAVSYFGAAAKGAETAKDKTAPALWVQAGNAALAANLPSDAVRYFNNALTTKALSNATRSGALIDRARAYVIGGQAEAAQTDLTEVRRIAPDNALGWLLSATLARRAGTLEQAQSFIKTAAALSPSDAAVALEAGNIAAEAGAYAIAQEQWLQTIRIAPQSVQADTARRLLDQLALHSPQTKAVPEPTTAAPSPTTKIAEPQSR